MRFGYFSIMVFVLLLLTSCAPKLSETVVAEYGNDKVTLGEFENAYLKSTGDTAQAKKDSLDKYKDFLNLYVVYKMKLNDAADKGYDKRDDLKKEFNDYKKSVGAKLIIEKKIKEPGIKDLYEKRKTEFRVSHILIRPNDTTSDEQAKEKAQMAIDELKKGANWNDMVQKYSDDTYSKKEGGDVYYLRKGTVVPEFENAAMATPVDSVYPKPVKTSFGYHVIKVTDRQPGRYMISAAHILIGFRNADGTTLDKDSARAIAEEVLQKLHNGGDWDELAKQYSSDPGSKDKGGELGFFERRRWIKEFEEVAFKLKVGEISGIVETRYGYHIIKCTGEKPYPPFEEQEKNLRSIFEKDRYQQALTDYIKKLKTEYNYKIDDETVAFIEANNDSIRFNDDYFTSDLRNQAGQKPVITFNAISFNLDSLVSYAKNQRAFAGQLIKGKSLNDAIDKFSEDALLDEEAMNLDKTDKSFADLMEDYKSGIYIFKLLEDEIWNKINIDSLAVLNYYEKHKDDYWFPERVSYKKINMKDDLVVYKIYEELTKGLDIDSVKAHYPKAVVTSSDKVDMASDEVSKKAGELKVGEISKPFKVQNSWLIVKLTDKIEPVQKTFEEARTEASGNLQESETKRLEEEYNNYLVEKYKPKYFYENLTNAFKAE